jgi:uncharacterized membrane protein
MSLKALDRTTGYHRPPREMLLDPATILAVLVWLREGLVMEGRLKRQQFWKWFRPNEAYGQPLRRAIHTSTRSLVARV